jgi:hypothetical protein
MAAVSVEMMIDELHAFRQISSLDNHATEDRSVRPIHTESVERVILEGKFGERVTEKE